MFNKYIYDLCDSMLSGEHRIDNMVYAKDSGIEIPKDSNPYLYYANAIMTIAQNAPIVIEDNTNIVGSATYIEARHHVVPFLECYSVSHTTIDFRIVLEKGTDYLKSKIQSKLTENPSISCQEPIKGDFDKRAFWEAQLRCIEAFEVWHERYLEELIKKGRHDIISYFKNIPMNPAKSFKEAVQSLYFTFTFVRLCGNWPGIGRIDEFLYPFYKNDLDNGLINYDEACEFLANMWVKGCEWAYGYNSEDSFQENGDAQHYQNIVLAGVDKDGQEVINPITYMVLDIAEELSISDFPISVRLNKITPEKLHRRIAEIIKKGGGIVACYNEEVMIRAMTRFGYKKDEARSFANDGCWETLVPGKTNFIYSPFDILGFFQEVLFNGVEYKDFESLYSAFEKHVEDKFYEFKRYRVSRYPNLAPAVLMSLFVEGCIEKGLCYHNLGPKYTVNAIHVGGIANVADSLGALKEFVFDKKEYSYKEYVDIIKSNWENKADLRIKALNCPKYGNDSEGDDMAIRVYDSFTKINEKIKAMDSEGNIRNDLDDIANFEGVLFPSGISTFGRELEWSKNRKATADGHLEGEVLAGNMDPSPNCDISGPTSMLKSYCKLDFRKLPNCGPLDMKLHPSAVKGEEGIQAIISLNKALVDLGGCFLQINVIDKETLLDAQAHPENHKNLSVRVSGWNARFATLDKHWQDMVINRTEIK